MPKQLRKNVLLQPTLQVKLGLLSTSLGGLFAVALFGVLHAQWTRLRAWLSLTEIRALVDAEVASYATDSFFWVALVLVVYLFLNTLLTVLWTHRLIGPTVAFRRHIQALTAGNYSARVSLRDGDAFGEVAEDLNLLAAALEEGRAAPPTFEATHDR